ncbi:hypothetical protein ES703_69659 [subsurface metagenome]
MGKILALWKKEHKEYIIERVLTEHEKTYCEKCPEQNMDKCFDTNCIIFFKLLAKDWELMPFSRKNKIKMLVKTFPRNLKWYELEDYLARAHTKKGMMK